MIIQKSVVFLRKTLAVILAGVFLFTQLESGLVTARAYASSYADNNKLAPTSRINNEEFKTSFAVDAICELIEKKAQYGKPLAEVTLEDIAKWKDATDQALNGCTFDARPEAGEVTIEIPSEGLAIRYFDPAKANVITPYSDVSKLSTRVISPRLNRQIIYIVKALSGEQDFTDTLLPTRLENSILFNRLKKLSGFYSPALEPKKQNIKYARYYHDMRVKMASSAMVDSITNASVINVNRDIVDIISLCHDMGHLPFAAMGQRALENVVGGFKYNEQDGLSQAIEILEKEERISLPDRAKGYLIRFQGVDWNDADLPAELKIVLISDMLVGKLEDIIFALRMNLIEETDIPEEIKTAFSLERSDIEEFKTGDIDATMQRLIQRFVNSEKFEADYIRVRQDVFTPNGKYRNDFAMPRIFKPIDDLIAKQIDLNAVMLELYKYLEQEYSRFDRGVEKNKYIVSRLIRMSDEEVVTMTAARDGLLYIGQLFERLNITHSFKELENNDKLKQIYESGESDRPAMKNMPTQINHNKHLLDLFEFKKGAWVRKCGDGLTLLGGLPFDGLNKKNFDEILGLLRDIEPKPQNLYTHRIDTLHFTIAELIPSTDRINDIPSVNDERQSKLNKLKSVCAGVGLVKAKFYYKDLTLTKGGDIVALGYVDNSSLFALRDRLRDEGLSSRYTNIVHVTIGRIFDEKLTPEKLEEYKRVISELRERKEGDGKPQLLGEITINDVKIWDQRCETSELRHGKGHDAISLTGQPRAPPSSAIGLTLQPLTKEFAEKHIDRLIELMNSMHNVNWVPDQLLRDRWDDGDYGRSGEKIFLAKWKHSIVAVDDAGDPIGLLLAYERPVDEEMKKIGKDSLYLQGFAVDSEWKERGIGKMLMHRLAENLIKNGFQEIEKDEEPVIALKFDKNIPYLKEIYEKFGFVIVGESLVKYENAPDHDDYVCMARAIDVFNKTSGEAGSTVVRNYKAYIGNNKAVFEDMLGEGKQNVLLRVPVEAIESAGKNNIKDFLETFQKAPNGYVELYCMSGAVEADEGVYGKYGLQRKPLPEDMKYPEKRTRKNTLTLFPVLKGEKLDQPYIVSKIGNMSPGDTILSPIGLQGDPSGLIRGTILGLKIMEIARTSGKIDKDEVQRLVLEDLKMICKTDDMRGLTADDIIYLAVSDDINKIMESLRKLIRLLPITPIDAEELRQIYERAKEALIAA